MATATYKVEVDWEGDLTWDHANSDVTADVRSARWVRGKDYDLDRPVVGYLEITLRNPDKTYSPDYGAGPIYGNLLPRRAIRLTTTAPAAYNLFYGYIERISPHARYKEQNCYILAYDGLDFLSRAEITTSLEKAIGTGATVTKILNAASWPAGQRSLDTGQDTVPYAYHQKVLARNALNDVEDSEVGLIYIDGAGDLVFEDRHHRFKPPHTTSQATFTDISDVGYILAAQHIYNEIRATITPWSLGALAVFWTLEQIGASSPLIPAGETVTYWADADGFLDSITEPVATTDYLANSASDGSGTNYTANIAIVTTKFAQTAKLAITNNASIGVYLTFLQVRGEEYSAEEVVTVKAEDATSQGKYQLRILPLNAKLMDDVAVGQDYCDYLISRHKEPQSHIIITLQNRDSTTLTQILSRKISDRITVTCADLGISGQAFYINKMEHSIYGFGSFHECRWTLAKIGQEGEFWCLGLSTLGDAMGQTSRLGY